MLEKMVFRSLRNNARISAWTGLTLTTCAALVTLFATVSFEVGEKMSAALRKVGANALVWEAADWAGLEAEAKGQGIEMARVRGRVGLVNGRAIAVMSSDPRALQRLTPYWAVTGKRAALEGECLAGWRAAEVFHLQPSSRLTVEWPGQRPATRATVTGIIQTGDEDDDRLFMAGLWPEGPFTYALLSAPGGEGQLASLQEATGASIKPLHQILHGERHVLDKIRVLFMTTLGVVLLLTAMGVSASMLARVVERRKELALLQAIGARRRDVVKLLLAEGAVVGVLAAGLGYALGSLLAAGVVRQIFQVGIAPRGLPFGAALATTTCVALLAGAIACGRMLRIQPAAALKGE
jgi:putative ABC transport system permease protein